MVLTAAASLSGAFACASKRASRSGWSARNTRISCVPLARLQGSQARHRLLTRSVPPLAFAWICSTCSGTPVIITVTAGPAPLLQQVFPHLIANQRTLLVLHAADLWLLHPLQVEFDQLHADGSEGQSDARRLTQVCTFATRLSSDGGSHPVYGVCDSESGVGGTWCCVVFCPGERPAVGPSACLIAGPRWVSSAANTTSPDGSSTRAIPVV